MLIIALLAGCFDLTPGKGPAGDGAPSGDLDGSEIVGGGPDDTDRPDDTDDTDDGTDTSDDDTGEEIAGEWLFVPTVVHDFHIDISSDAIRDVESDPDTDVHATFTYAGRAYDVGLHLKGNYSYRDFGGKPSMKIDFHEWIPDQTLLGVRRITLNNMIQDGSMMRDEAAYYLFRESGCPAPRHGYARVWVNGEWYGLYSLVENPDEQFLGDHFVSNDGNVYSGGYGADIAQGRAHLFELQEDSGAAGTPVPFEDLQALIDAFEAGGDYMTLLETHFDADLLLRMWAVELVSGQDDGYVSYGNNYLLYNDPGATKWWMIPWGPDQSFDTVDGIYAGWFGRLAQRCQADDACMERLEPQIEHVLATWEATDFPAYMTEIQRVIVADCEADPRRERSCLTNQVELLDFIEGRADVVRSQM